MGKSKDTEHYIYYTSQIKARDHRSIVFYIPNNLDVLEYPEGAEFTKGDYYQVFVLSDDNAIKNLFFLYNDLDEKEEIEDKEKNIGIFIAFILGLIGSVIATYVYEKYIKKNKTLQGNVKTKYFNKHSRITINVLKKK